MQSLFFFSLRYSFINLKSLTKELCISVTVATNTMSFLLAFTKENFGWGIFCFSIPLHRQPCTLYKRQNFLIRKKAVAYKRSCSVAIPLAYEKMSKSINFIKKKNH